MIKLRKVLQTHLKTIHPRVYFQTAPDTAQFPYLTYDIPNILDSGEGHQTVTIDIDGWDSPTDGDTTALENLMTAVNDGLNKHTLADESIAVTFYLDTKLALSDNDPRIRRRKYVYQGRLFERS